MQAVMFITPHKTKTYDGTQKTDGNIMGVRMVCPQVGVKGNGTGSLDQWGYSLRGMEVFSTFHDSIIRLS